MCSSLGTVHIFRLLSNTELIHCTKQLIDLAKKKDQNSWLWNKVTNAIPTNLTMNGSTIRYHLNQVANFNENQQ